MTVNVCSFNIKILYLKYYLTYIFSLAVSCLKYMINSMYIHIPLYCKTPNTCINIFFCKVLPFCYCSNSFLYFKLKVIFLISYVSVRKLFKFPRKYNRPIEILQSCIQTEIWYIIFILLLKCILLYNAKLCILSCSVCRLDHIQVYIFLSLSQSIM